MSTLLTVILLICGYLALTQAVNAMSRTSYYSSRNTIIIDVVVAIMYIIVCGIVGLLYIYSGYNMMIIYFVSGFGVLITLILFIRFCVINRYSMKKGNVLLFIVYFAVVLYLTIFMRIGSVDTSVVTVPFGYLISAMNPDRLRKCSFAFLGGIVCSTVIGYLAIRFVWQFQKNWKL